MCFSFDISRIKLIAFALLSVVLISPANADLVYSSFQDNIWNIYYQTDPMGRPQRILGLENLEGSAPTINPAGNTIAFETQGRGITVCEINTILECQTVPSNHGYGVRPTWQPKTGQLLFVNYNVDATTEDADIFITPDSNSLTSASPLILQTGIQDYPDVSSDGQWLAYTSSQTISLRQGGVQVVQQLWLMDLIIGRAHQLFTGSHQDIHPDWSPSSKEIAFSTNSSGQFEIWIIDKEGNNLRQVTSGAGSKTWPAWSPDGKSIMFTMMKQGRYSLWIVDIDGSNLRPFQPFGSDKNLQMRDADWQ